MLDMQMSKVPIISGYVVRTKFDIYILIKKHQVYYYWL